MKRSLQYIALLSALLLAGCEDPIENDKALIESFDPTAPAHVMMSHSMKAIAAASGALVQACNFNEWLTAEGEEARLAVEDKYYTYLKVREMEDHLWNIYSQYYTESYFLKGGLNLNQEGAVWQIRQCPRFIFPHLQYSDNSTSNTTTSTPTITRVEEDCFEVTFNNAAVYFGGATTSRGLYSYLSDWSSYNDNEVDLRLTITTNDGAFRRGEEEVLTFSIRGNGTITARDYTLRFSTGEPIVMSFGTNAMILQDTVGVGVVDVMNTLNSERVSATFSPYNAIVVEYTPKGSAPVIGYYDWAGNRLSPR